MEETGLQLKNIQFKTVLNAVEVDNNYHYIDLFMCGEVDLDYKREPENLEPNKCEGNDSEKCHVDTKKKQFIM